MLKYYSFNYILSFNAVFNFILGARGLGKTYGAKYRAIKKALHSKEQFIYMRRYKTDLESRLTFFADIEHEFPDWDFRVNGHVAQASHISTRESDKRPWKDLGFFIALSTAHSKKSVSYHNVTTIIYDEFIIEKGVIHYISGEAKAFMEFYNTVDRYKDKTKVFFLANSVSIDNPYFLKYDIIPNAGEKIILKYDGFVACHFPDNAEFKDGVRKTRFGKFMMDTDPDYVDYAVNNKFSDNHGLLIEKKTPESEYIMTVETEKGTFSVWCDWDSEIWYFQRKRPKGGEVKYTVIEKNVDTDKNLLLRSDKLNQYIRTAYRQGRARFDRAQTRNSMIELFK